MWKVVENQKRIEITERFGVNIRVRRTILPYVVDEDESFIIRTGTQIIHPKTKQIAEILRFELRTMGLSLPQIRSEMDVGWKIFDEDMNTFRWSHNRSLRPISSISCGGKELIINAEPTAEWFNLVLDTDDEIDDSAVLLIDGQKLNGRLSPVRKYSVH